MADVRLPRKVFISYSHDSEKHRDRVLAFADRLRHDGIDACIDQYVAGDAIDWPRWMTQQIAESDIIFVVCTETYRRRLLDREAPRIGLGVIWESNIILNLLYEPGTRGKIIPVVFSEDDVRFVPEPLIGRTRFNPGTTDGYEKLLQWLGGGGGAPMPELARRERQWMERPTAIINVPRLPEHYIPRAEHEELIGSLLQQSDSGATPHSPFVGVHAAGGSGKSVIAAAVARDSRVAARFGDGIIWLVLGQKAPLEQRQADLIDILSAVRPAILDCQSGKLQLSKAAAGKRILLVLDDAWTLEQVQMFDALSPESRALVTTRKGDVLRGIGARTHPLHALETGEALSLLARASGREPSALPDAAHRVVKRCGNSPLALAMIGAMVAGIADPWDGVLARLESAALDRIAHAIAEYPHPDLLRAIALSITDLGALADRFLDLAVFPEDTPIPAAAIHALWSTAGLDALDTQLALKTFVDRALIEVDLEQRYTLHDLLFLYLQKHTPQTTELHERLLQAYRRLYARWEDGSPDGYYFQHLLWHLVKAARNEEGRALLTHYPWLHAKLRSAGVTALVRDYDLFPEDKDLRLVRRTLRLAGVGLAVDSMQLPGQLLARLDQSGSESRSIAQLVDASGLAPGVWIRPLASTLTRGTSPLLQILTGHTKRIEYLIKVDPLHVLSSSYDGTCRLWRLDEGIEVRSFEHGVQGEQIPIARVDRGRFVSAVASELWLWDLDSGRRIATFSGHTADIVDVATIDGTTIVSADRDANVLVWNVDDCAELSRFPLNSDKSFGHFTRIQVLNQRFLVCVTGDRSVDVRDLQDGALVQHLAGHRDTYPAFCVLGDRTVFSSTDYGVVTMWNALSGEKLRTFEAQQDWVRDLAVLGETGLAWALDDGSIEVTDLASGKRLERFGGHSGAVCACVQVSDTQIVSASDDSTLRLWELATGNTQSEWPSWGADKEIEAVAFFGDDRVIAAAPRDSEAEVHNAHTGERLGVLAHSHVGFIFPVDDNRAFTCSRTEQAVLWNLSSFERLLTLESTADASSDIVRLGDGRIALLAYMEAIVWNPATGLVDARLPVDVEVGAMTAVGESQIVLGGYHGALTMYDHKRGVRLWKVDSGAMMIGCHVAALGPDRFVSAEDEALRIWDAKSGELLYRCEGHGNRIEWLATFPDRILSAGYDGTVRLWDASDGHALGALRSSQFAGTPVVAALAAERFAWADGLTIRIHDVRDLAPVASFTLEAAANVMSGSTDGVRLAVGDVQGNVQTFELRGVTRSSHRGARSTAV